MEKANVSAFLKKYTMVIVLIIVTLFFTWKTGGRMLLPQNVNNLISQNAYVFILATGMLLCILTGGNIDLSVGSIVCIVGAVGATCMVNLKMNIFASILIMLATGLVIGIWQGFWIAYRRIPPFIPWPHAGAGRRKAVWAYGRAVRRARGAWRRPRRGACARPPGCRAP